MKRNKLLILFALTLSASLNCHAQKNAEIQGQVRDSVSKVGISYATVQLFDSIGTFQNGTITDSLGWFVINKIPQQKYNIVVSCLGYKTKRLSTNINERLTYKFFNLSEDAKMLENVSVTGDRITQKDEVDKSVYTLDDFTLKNSVTAFDALKKIPNVTVRQSDESVKVNGSSNVLILVDGYYSTRDLKSINPEDIASIEVITNPSVEYDSDVANVINIVLKEERKQGLRLIVGTFLSAPDSWNSANIQTDYEFSKFRLFANYRFFNYRSIPEWMNDSTSSSVIDDDSNRYLETGNMTGKYNSNKHRFQYGMDYRINKNNLLSFTGNYIISDMNSRYQFENQYFKNNINIYDDNSIYKSESQMPEQNYSLFYRHKFKKKGHQISLNTNLYKMEMNSESEYYSDFYYYEDSVTKSSSVFNNNDNSQTIWNTKLNYELPISKKLKILAGVQTYFRKIDYEYNDSIRIQYFDYQDFRTAPFAQVIYSPSEKISLMAGLRCENLEFKIYDTVKNSQWNYLPSATAMYKINERNSLKLNYKTLLKYPSYNYLSPFVYTETDSLVYSSGNPELDPEKTQTVSISYNYKKRQTRLLVEPYFSLTKGLIGQKRDIYGAVTEMTYKNIENSIHYGGRVWASCLVAGFIMPMIGVDVYYSSFENSEYDGWSYEFYASLEMELFWDFCLNADFSYYGKTYNYDGYTHESPLVEEIALSRSFLNDKLDVGLSMVNFFLPEKSEEVIYGANYRETSNYEVNNPYLMLSLRYVFTAGSRKIVNEERESLMESEENVPGRK